MHPNTVVLDNSIQLHHRPHEEDCLSFLLYQIFSHFYSLSDCFYFFLCHSLGHWNVSSISDVSHKFFQISEILTEWMWLYTCILARVLNLCLINVLTWQWILDNTAFQYCFWVITLEIIWLLLFTFQVQYIVFWLILGVKLLVVCREGESKPLVEQMLSYKGEDCIMSFKYSRYIFPIRKSWLTCVIQLCLRLIGTLESWSSGTFRHCQCIIQCVKLSPQELWPSNNESCPPWWHFNGFCFSLPEVMVSFVNYHQFVLTYSHWLLVRGPQSLSLYLSLRCQNNLPITTNPPPLRLL